MRLRTAPEYSGSGCSDNISSMVCINLVIAAAARVASVCKVLPDVGAAVQQPFTYVFALVSVACLVVSRAVFVASSFLSCCCAVASAAVDTRLRLVVDVANPFARLPTPTFCSSSTMVAFRSVISSSSLLR